jgi:hypothetical protein
MLHLFTVADVFVIEGRGCVLVPGLPTEPGSPNVQRDAKIRLKTPSGKFIDTTIRAIEMVTYRKRPEKMCLPILLPDGIGKDDVPIGTEVILFEDEIEK